MYKVRFNTANFKSNKRRRYWENQLMDDFAVAINGKEFNCKTEKGLIQRLHFIDHSICESYFTLEEYTAFLDDKNNYIELESDRYGKQRHELSMYGIPQGYIDFDKVVESVEKDGYYKLPFGSFYDLRQGNFFKGCFVEIFTEPDKEQ